MKTEEGTGSEPAKPRFRPKAQARKKPPPPPPPVTDYRGAAANYRAGRTAGTERGSFGGGERRYGGRGGYDGRGGRHWQDSRSGGGRGGRDGRGGRGRHGGGRAGGRGRGGFVPVGQDFFVGGGGSGPTAYMPAGVSAEDRGDVTGETNEIENAFQRFPSRRRKDWRKSGRARLNGATTLVAVLNEMPRHEEKRQRLGSMLQDMDQHLRSQIAEAARSTAGLRLSAKKRGAERLRLDDEIATFRKELVDMTGEDEVQSRMTRARQAGKGLERRLQHASEKLATVQESLAQGAAKHMGEEEQQSLELMRGIAEGKARLNSLVHISGVTTRSSSSNGGGSGRLSSPAQAPSQPRHQTQGSRGGLGEKKSGYHSWVGGWS